MDKWELLKKLLETCYNQVDENKLTYEKKLYKDILDTMAMYENVEEVSVDE